MAIDTELYSTSYLRRREAWSASYTSIAKVFEETFGIGSIVDVGCAGGLLVEALRARGYEAWGIDGAPGSVPLWPDACRTFYTLGDFTAADTIDLPPTEYVCSLEVAEHLPDSCAVDFVALLTRHHPRRVLFTAAPTGQIGEGHVNCRPFSYWIGLFAARGYALDEIGSCRVRSLFRRQPAGQDVPSCYINNFLAFGPETPAAMAAGHGLDPAMCLRDELAAQHAILEYLLHRMTNVIELSALLSRGLGMPTELTDDAIGRVRHLAY